MEAGFFQDILEHNLGLKFLVSKITDLSSWEQTIVAWRGTKGPGLFPYISPRPSDN